MNMYYYYFSSLIIFFFSIIFFILSLFFLFKDLVYYIEWEITSINSLMIMMTFLFDWMSLLFMSFVLFISSIVIIYSKEYMGDDNNMNRFIILILLFIFSMMMLIISPNLISILLGWDGLGLISYCLVIYFQNFKSYNAGMLTALSNRLGDSALLLAISWMMNFGSWSFIFFFDFFLKDSDLVIVSCLVLIAALTKSAQIPFSSWLPAAMAAPTPVSALVHSSTLVTAGVYLMIRFNLIFFNYYFMIILLLLGSLTMFMSGLGANYEMDLKKTIALSTLSQLGLMMSILSLGFYKLAFFHLLTHALFKALMFLCAGGMIHNFFNIQDIRFMGSLTNLMPLSMFCFNVASLALCGMPFLAGFYSKDMILEILMMNNINLVIFFIFFSTGLTVSYSFRLIYFICINKMMMFCLLNLSENNSLMMKSMMILMFMSIIGGSVLSWLMFPYCSYIYLPFYLKFLILFICFLGMMMGYFIFKMKNLNMFIYFFSFFFLKYFFSCMWFMPILSTFFISSKILLCGYKYSKILDFGWMEYYGGGGIFNMLKNYSIKLNYLLTNYLFIYFIFLVFFFII